MAPAAMEDEEDPVVAEYDVYITPEIHEQIYVLQYLNRERKHGGFKRSNDNEPTELRVKEQSGFVEVDVPLDIRTSFNRTAGVKWGEALRKTKGFGQKAYGISSGFERVMPKSAPKSAAGANGTPVPVALDDDDNQDEWVAHFEDANEKGHVLNTQTFGGQIAKEDGKGPRYMLGAFKDKTLHLTKAHGLVQMRPQFHYIDAISQLEIVSRRREREAQDGAKTSEPKTILPTVKKAGGDTTVEITQAFMKATSQERWKKLEYSDEDSQHAWRVFGESMYLADPSTAPKLKSSMSNREYLDAISAPSSGKGKRKSAAKAADELVEISDESDEDEQPNAGEKGEEEPKVSERDGEVQATDAKEGA